MNEENNMNQWASEYPQFASLIRKPGWRRIFAKEPPPNNEKVTDEQWNLLVTHLQSDPE